MHGIPGYYSFTKLGRIAHSPFALYENFIQATSIDRSIWFRTNRPWLDDERDYYEATSVEWIYIRLG